MPIPWDQNRPPPTCPIRTTTPTTSPSLFPHVATAVILSNFIYNTSIPVVVIACPSSSMLPLPLNSSYCH